MQKKAGSLPASQQITAPKSDLSELLSAAVADTDEESIGMLLMEVVELARSGGIDPETALRTVALRRRDAARAFELANQPEA